MAKLNDVDYCQDIVNLHNAGIKWNAIAVIKSVSYEHLVKEKNNPKSQLAKMITVGKKAKAGDLARGVITNIALNGFKDSDKLNAAKYMLDSEEDGGSVTTKDDTTLKLEILAELKAQ